MTDTRTTEGLVARVKRVLNMRLSQHGSVGDRDSDHKHGWPFVEHPADEALVALDTITSRLEAYEAEHEAWRVVRERDNLAEYSLDDLYDAEGLHTVAHEHAERVRNGD